MIIINIKESPPYHIIILESRIEDDAAYICIHVYNTNIIKAKINFVNCVYYIELNY